MWFIATKLVDFPEGPESLQMPEEIRQPVEENKANTLQGCKTKYRKWFVDKVCGAIHPNNYKPDNVESIEVDGEGFKLLCKHEVMKKYNKICNKLTARLKSAD